MPVGALPTQVIAMTVPSGFTVKAGRRAGDTSKAIYITVNKSAVVTVNGTVI